jgi:hypothetical protein
MSTPATSSTTSSNSATTAAASAVSALTVPSGSPTIAALIQNVLQYQYNPASIAQVAFNYLNEVTSGLVNIVDPSNPYVHAIETSAVNTAAFMEMVKAQWRKQYPVSALTMKDLYTHMSDTDYVDRFATPATTTWTLAFGENELLNKLVEDPTTGLMQLTIPRNTYFTVGGVQFSLQYPINIVQAAHGGLSITYDTTEVSPLQTLTTNLVDWEYRQASDQNWIFLTFPVQQFDIITRTGTCTPSRMFQTTIALKSQFYYCRVYAWNTTTSAWDEMETTYSTEIYDPLTPTAVITVDTSITTGVTQVEVMIPQVYTTSGLLNSNIRIDVYETSGPLNMNLANYDASAFAANFYAIDQNDITIYTTPFNTFSTVLTYSDEVVIGGTNAVSFTTLRQQVIDNSVGPQQLPITPAQLQDTLEQDGFGVVKNVDNITNRSYLATAPMPQPTDDTLITAACSQIATIAMSVNQAVTNSAVIDNNTSVTITPAALYQNINGVVSMVSDEVLAQLTAMTPTNLALAINAGNYFWSPFHYVVDMTSDELALRPYYLNAPAVETKLWVGENDTTQLEVSTDTYTLTQTATGYSLTLATTSNAAYQAIADNQVFCQLSFIPPGQTARAYLNGTLTGTTSAGERLFTFDLSTNYNVDADSNLYLTKFFMYNTNAGQLTACPLENTIDVVYGTTATMPSTWVTSAVDTKLGRFLLGSNAVGITNEQLVIEFGQYLEWLWASARTVVSTVQYQTYTVNVPYYYTEDVYEPDPTTGLPFSIVNNEVVFTILHAAGQPVLNADGSPSYQYVVGDVILDAQGNPIPVSARSTTQNLDIMLIEASYRFANDTVAPTYVSQLLTTVVGWLTGQFDTLNEMLLEQTELFYYPTSNIGTIQVYGQDGLIYNLDAGQSFTVNCNVAPNVAANTTLLQQLETATISNIAALLAENEVVSNSMIYGSLEELYGTDVISFTFSGLGGGVANFSTITLVDDSSQLGIAKNLIVNANGTLSVEEAVTVNFASYAPGGTAVS